MHDSIDSSRGWHAVAIGAWLLCSSAACSNKTTQTDAMTAAAGGVSGAQAGMTGAGGRIAGPESAGTSVTPPVGNGAAGNNAGIQPGSAGAQSGDAGMQSSDAGMQLPADGRADGGADGGEMEVMRPPPECEGETGTAACRACTYQGWVQGAPESSSCSYLGIPYGKPPVGELRFAAPEPAAGWDGVREATDFGAACMQGMDLSGSTNLSEDCLYINVWTPAAGSDEPLPVMVYVYGGGYTGGATNTYVGRDLSEAGNVVVVSMNYRVGALGFFAHPALDAERSDAPSGSDGIRDQQLALRWVKDNIASFHGDPHNVTIFGESAGSSSVGIHLVSPGSRGLLRRYIMESGVPTRGVANGIAPVSRETMYARTQQLVDDLCPNSSDVLGCLRGLPADRLMSWAPSGGGGGGSPMELGWVPVVEGEGGVLPDTPDALMKSGHFNPGEIIVGTNLNEYGLFALLSGSATSVANMRNLVQAKYPDSTDEIMALYAPNDSVDANQAYITMMTDVMFRCATRNFARIAAGQGRDVYLYSFEEGTAWHSDELVYIFGYGFFGLGLAPPVGTLSDTMRGYWLSFAHSGDPNGDGRPTWPKFDEAGDQYIRLANPPKASSGLEKEACDFWDDYLASH